MNRIVLMLCFVGFMSSVLSQEYYLQVGVGKMTMQEGIQEYNPQINALQIQGGKRLHKSFFGELALGYGVTKGISTYSFNPDFYTESSKELYAAYQGNFIYPYYKRSFGYLDASLVYRSSFGVEYFAFKAGLGGGLAVGRSNVNLYNGEELYDFTTIVFSSLFDEEAIRNVYDDTFETRIPVNTVLPQFVVNVGVSYEVVHGFILGMDVRMQNTFKDNLDGVAFNASIPELSNDDYHTIVAFSAVFEFY